MRRSLRLCAFSWAFALGALAGPAHAQTGAPGSTPSATASAASAEAVLAKPVVSDSTDTRGSAMRVYQAALEKLKLGASAALSLQRIRDDLGSIEEKLSAGRRDEAIGDL